MDPVRFQYVDYRSILCAASAGRRSNRTAPAAAGVSGEIPKGEIARVEREVRAEGCGDFANRALKSWIGVELFHRARRLSDERAPRFGRPLPRPFWDGCRLGLPPSSHQGMSAGIPESHP